MIEDFVKVAGAGELEADIAIIGGGPASIAMALSLADKQQKVIVLEAGQLDLDDDAQQFAKGTLSGIPYFPLDECRYRMLGGATFRWGARTAPLKPFDYEVRSWVERSGWPIGPADLAPYYDAVYRMVDIHMPFGFDEDVWNYLGTKPEKFDPAIFQYNGFQFGKNLLFGSVYRDALRRAEQVRVLINAQVLNIATDSSGGNVEHLEVGHINGARAKVKARRYVLAAGGIENARLLLLSGGPDGRGLGNSSDMVGRYFMEHPTVSGGKIISDNLQRIVDIFSPGLIGGRLVEVALSLTPEEQRAAAVLTAYARANVVVEEDATQALRELLRNLKHRRLPHQLSWYQKNKWLTQRLGTILRDPFSIVGNAVRHALGKPKRFKLSSVYLELRTEQGPNPESRVTLGDELDGFGQRRAHLHWEMTEQDKKTMRVLTEKVDAELRRLDLGHVEMADWLAADELSFGADMMGGHHHMGTTRMSVDPEMGVVDADCRMHDLGNLYVAGSSVFPTAGFVNPTATLIALSLRLADHLKQLPD